MKKKQVNFYGKAWTVEWNTDKDCWITEATSAITVKVCSSGWTSNFKVWSRVPAYLRRIIHRRLRK